MSAAQILAELERAASRAQPDDPGLFVFYYSGHSDGQHLFPGGQELALADLRAAIERLPARVHVAILDTCRGGSWTNTKGSSVGPALRASDLLDAETAGTALLSSSSGVENAHEAAVYGGSFFTHHVAAALLGAADASGDGLLDDPVPGSLVFGALQSLGYRPLPLVQLHVSEWLSIDAYARLLGGVTWTF